MTHCAMHTHVSRHFAGTISPPAERSMREHMQACPSCRDLYRRHVLLARLDPNALPAEERIARGLGLRSRPKVAALGFMAAAAAAVLLLQIHPAGDGFSSRGSVGSVAPRTSHVLAYVVRNGSPAPVGNTLHSGDELAFAYENGSAKLRLAVFGVDEHGHVYWFHPAWTREADDPVAVPIATDGQLHELPEAVLQQFDGRRLEIRSVFVDDPISVRRLEALIRQHPWGALPLSGAVETSLTLAVTP
jgi:hypothetical protein